MDLLDKSGKLWAFNIIN